MRDLHLPGAQHLLYVCNYVLEGQRFLEIIARPEIGTNFLRGDGGQNGAVRNVGLQLFEIRTDFIDNHGLPFRPNGDRLTDEYRRLESVHRVPGRDG